jgi:hypothetical protein
MIMDSELGEVVENMSSKVSADTEKLLERDS